MKELIEHQHCSYMLLPILLGLGGKQCWTILLTKLNIVGSKTLFNLSMFITTQLFSLRMNLCMGRKIWPIPCNLFHKNFFQFSYLLYFSPAIFHNGTWIVYPLWYLQFPLFWQTKPDSTWRYHDVTWFCEWYPDLPPLMWICLPVIW